MGETGGFVRDAEIGCLQRKESAPRDSEEQLTSVAYGLASKGERCLRRRSFQSSAPAQIPVTVAKTQAITCTFIVNGLEMGKHEVEMIRIMVPAMCTPNKR